MYLLPTEPRYGSISCRKSPIPNWTSFREFVKYGEKHLEELEDIEMFGIDTADALSKFCMQYVCGRDGVAHPTDQEWGKGWEAYKDEWTYWLYRLASLGKGIMFVCHEKEREITSRGMKVTKLSPAAPTTCYTVIQRKERHEGEKQLMTHADACTLSRASCVMEATVLVCCLT
jgi:hypothetical protein